MRCVRERAISGVDRVTGSGKSGVGYRGGGGREERKSIANLDTGGLGGWTGWWCWRRLWAVCLKMDVMLEDGESDEGVSGVGEGAEGG